MKIEGNISSSRTDYVGKIILIVTICIVILLYWRWALPGVITWGDWTYATKSTMVDFSPTLWGSVGGLGNLQIISVPYFPVLTLQGFMCQALNLDFTFLERLLIFYPLVLLFVLSPWYLARTLKFNYYGTALTILVFNLNPLEFFNTGVPFIALAEAIGVLVLAALIRVTRHPTVHRGIILGLAFALQLVYESRIAYVTLLFCGLYLFYFFTVSFPKNPHNLRQICKTLLIAAILVVLLHSYWLAPLMTEEVFGTAPSLLPQGYDNIGMVRALSYHTLLHSLGIHVPWWGRPNIVNPVNAQFLILPLIVFGIFLFRYKFRTILFFSLSAVVFAFLVKGSQPPFGEIYIWFFQHIPGFSMFRVPGKWWMPVVVSYAVLLGFIGNQLSNRYAVWRARHTKSNSIFIKLVSILAAIGFFFFIFPVQPISTLNYSIIYEPRSVPEEYFRLETFLHDQPQFFRTLWMPRHQRFGYYSSQHPILSTAILERIPILSKFLKDGWINMFSHPFIKDILRLLSVKYIILPYDSLNDFYFLKHSMNYYQNLIKNNLKLTSVGFRGKTQLYEIPNPLPHIYISCRVEK